MEEYFNSGKKIYSCKIFLYFYSSIMGVYEENILDEYQKWNDKINENLSYIALIESYRSSGKCYALLIGELIQNVVFSPFLNHLINLFEKEFFAGKDSINLFGSQIETNRFFYFVVIQGLYFFHEFPRKS